MKIGTIDLDREVLTIAEIGNNHEGSLAAAEDMVGRAARAGARAVKFQTIVPERLVAATEAERLKQLRRFALTYEQFEALARIARQEGVLFLSTPFDIASARFLDSLVPAFKIASGDNDFFPLLDAVAATGKPVLVSTGMTCLADVERTQRFLDDAWKRHGKKSALVLLHCVSSYPTPPQDANLRAIPELAKLGVTVGYSDHTLGIEAAVLAVALGARVIEKHFTLDKTRSSFRDHQLSADPEDFRRMVDRIREAEAMLGDGRKTLMTAEKDTAIKARRSLVAARDLPAGTVIADEDLDWLRPGGGLRPGEENRIVGKKLRRELKRGEAFSLEDVVPCAA